MQPATKFRPEEAAFHLALQAGFGHIEFWLNDEVLSRHEAVAATAGRFPFQYVLHFPNQSGLAEKTLRQAVELYHQLACSVMVIHEPMLTEYGRQLYGIDPGLTLAVENHFQDRSGIREWAARYNALTLDVEHLWKFTLHDAPLSELLAEVEMLLSRHADRVRHVHLPGYLPGFDEHRPMYQSAEMVEQVLTMLAQAGYSGFVVSETHEPFQNLPDLQADLALFERWNQSGKSAVDAARNV